MRAFDHSRRLHQERNEMLAIADKKGVWVSQTSRLLKIGKIRTHENSEAHRQALAMEVQRRKSQAPITEALEVQETTHRKAMKSIFRK